MATKSILCRGYMPDIRTQLRRDAGKLWSRPNWVSHNEIGWVCGEGEYFCAIVQVRENKRANIRLTENGSSIVINIPYSPERLREVLSKYTEVFHGK